MIFPTSWCDEGPTEWRTDRCLSLSSHRHPLKPQKPINADRRKQQEKRQSLDSGNSHSRQVHPLILRPPSKTACVCLDQFGACVVLQAGAVCSLVCLFICKLQSWHLGIRKELAFLLVCLRQVASRECPVCAQRVLYVFMRVWWTNKTQLCKWWRHIFRREPRTVANSTLTAHKFQHFATEFNFPDNWRQDFRARSLAVHISHLKGTRVMWEMKRCSWSTIRYPVKSSG